MKRILTLLLCLAMTAGLFAGCAAENRPYIPSGDALVYDDTDLNQLNQDEEKEPQEFSLAYYSDRSLNPITSTDYTNRTIFSLVYQGLFSVNSDYEAVPILCDRYEVSSNYKIYTVYLREDARFSDGSVLTVDDVLASYEAARNSKYFGGRFTHIADISGSGTAIVFTLSVEMENLLLLLDIPIVKSTEVEAESPLGSGPYMLEKTMTGAHLRKNADWWCSSPDLVVRAEAIPLISCDSPTAIRDQFEFEDVGLVCADPCSDSYADFRCDYEVWDCESGVFLFLAVNVKYSEYFEDNARVISNLTYGIDRETLAEDNYRGFAQAVTLAASPSSPYYSMGLASKYDYDPVQLVNAVNNAKKPEEPLNLLVNRDDSLRLRTARDIAQMLTDCGLETVTVEKNSSDFQKWILAGNYDMYLGQTRLSANMDLSPFFKPWGDMSYNGISDESLYSLCKDALENSGNYYTLHQAVANDGRITPILFCNYAVYAERGLLTDLQPSRDNVFYYTLGRSEADALIPIDYDSTGDVVTGVG
ncbi:MAG: ABC transporter substrate-binding protein [Oscillospiraceae bacterium]|nr:ABC transporter substrate-binding protein [Oscillospiraceae bacterium]MBO5324272.1 ABC transporter substrate-binding protein [Oscillospiraceae bacterium]